LEIASELLCVTCYVGWLTEVLDVGRRVILPAVLRVVLENTQVASTVVHTVAYTLHTSHHLHLYCSFVCDSFVTSHITCSFYARAVSVVDA
jgi:hypothetical protein